MDAVRRVAVLGSGTMGSRIAAHFANAGYPVLLLDIAAPKLEPAKQKPAAFFTEAAAGLIETGTFDDDLAKLRGCQWILEAVVENLEIKRSLLSRVAAVRAPGSIVSTNTSGIPLALLMDGFAEEFRRHFLGTHFFNPPRYLHLLEIIPNAATGAEVIEFVSAFCDRHLGKGVVPCKDTPNFIANRIGCFFGATIHKLAVEGEYTVEEVDALTGPLVGLPNSASFRLVDIIGLDVWCHVMRNLYEAVPGDPWRERFTVPPFLDRMKERGLLGEKSGQGFYRREGKGDARQILALDRETLEYHPAEKPRFPSVESAKGIADLGERMRTLMAGRDRAGLFLWNLFTDLFAYSAYLVPEISGRVVEIDRAMRWGYAHKLGPFEMWDALGVPATVARMQAENRFVPENVERMLAYGAGSFYTAADHDGQPRTRYFDLAVTAYRELEPRPGVLVLSETKRARGVVRSNAEASLVDLGDGVLCLEFHSRMNTIGEDLVSMIGCGLEETARNFEAMVIANQGEHFSAGANLAKTLAAAEAGDWNGIDAALARFQQVNMALKYAAKPVVAAPFGMTLGGGCEIALHAARAQASAETYIGLVETGAGVIPAGGGCKELLLRLGDAKRAFDLIAYAKVSTSAANARELGLLRPQDQISMNPERLVADAKALALSLAPTWAPGVPDKRIAVGGENLYAVLKRGIYLAREAEFITEYDAVVGEKLAYVLSGGQLTAGQVVSEQYLLDLEREAFLGLCGNRETRDRMEHLLKTGKPLRN